jgi:archaellum biogenesis ATPase FlaH
VEQTEKFCQEKALHNAILESIQILDGKTKTDKTKGAIPQILADALSVSFDPNIGHSYLEDSEKRYEFYHRTEKRIPFDLDYFNRITKGGLPQKTLNVILAGTGTGKSLFMCHHASACLAQNYNVLYITLEMAEERIAERIDANLLNVKLDDLTNLPKDTYERKISRLRENIKGKLIIKEYPTASASSTHFRNLLNELALKRNFTPDIVFVDYLNICASSRLKHGANVNSYSYIKAIAEELRGLAVEFKIPIVTATQTTRTGFCLSLDTKVTVDGININIKDVKLGDKILSNTGNNIVTTIFPFSKKKMYRIKTQSGKEIICSAEHIFPTSRGDLSIRNGMSIGDYLLTQD